MVTNGGHHPKNDECRSQTAKGVPAGGGTILSRGDSDQLPDMTSGEKRDQARDSGRQPKCAAEPPRPVRNRLDDQHHTAQQQCPRTDKSAEIRVHHTPRPSAISKSYYGYAS